MFQQCVASAEQLNLAKDVNGWTIFSPSVDTDVVYVDSVTGNDTTCRSYRTTDAEMGADPFNPAGAIIPCATLAKAVTFSTSAAQPDWVLFKRGSVFNSGLVTDKQMGRSVTEPRVFAAYGSSGAMPIFRGGFENDGNSSTQFLAISGLDFYRDTRDPSSPNYAPEEQATTGMLFFAHEAYNIKSILIEGCRIRFFVSNIVIGPSAPNGSGDITIRRNTILNAHSRLEGHSQGMSMAFVDNIILEENVFDHNGWLVQSDGDETTEDGEATIFNHNIYTTDAKNMSLKNNIFIRASSNNVKIKYKTTGVGEGLVIDNNLYLGGEIAISIGAPDEHAIYSVVNPTITGNVWVYPGMWNPTNRELAWFFYNFNWDGGLIDRNLMVHQDEAAYSGHFFHIQFSGRNTVISNNIVDDVKNITTVYFEELDTGNSDRAGFVFSGNTFDTDGGYIVQDTLDDPDAYTISGNKYHSTKTADTWFRSGASTLTDAQWITATGDNSTFEQVTFPDPDRDLATYMASLGETATIDTFIAKARAQDRYNWDARYTADVVNDYIRAGFGMSEYTPPGQSRRLFRNVRVGEVEP